MPVVIVVLQPRVSSERLLRLECPRYTVFGGVTASAGSSADLDVFCIRRRPNSLRRLQRFLGVSGQRGGGRASE